MKKLLTGLSVAGGLLVGVNAASATPSICDADIHNLVQNCGFETGNFSDWSASGPGFPSISNDRNSGNWALYLAVAGGGPAAPSIDLSQTLSVKDGRQYSVSFYLKDVLDGSAQSFAASVDGLHGVLGQFSLSGAQSGYGAYTKVSFDFTADSASAKLDFNLTDNTGFATWGLDDVQVDALQAVPEPDSLALFGPAIIGLAGLAALRRRRKPVA